MYHLEFLAAAIEVGSAAVFTDYLRWAGRVLAARGIPPALLIESVEQVVAAALARETGPEARLIEDIRDEALAALQALRDKRTPPLCTR